ncbi:hypothetical protein BpHYR1_017645 [Brachionus plicatilis]|uniref:Uncharacterized protein n=1 Tax=Brachionus plicatilis TaxID=10195 RepID=A0A3M7P4W8_BRAPC|nr:hypothetical protein BpHYR1_017645 [Brachionus plicatilis]
MIIQEKNLKK